MHLTDHCITDLKSLYAVVKIARRAKRSYVTCPVSLYYQATNNSPAIHTWFAPSAVLKVRWAYPDLPSDHTVNIDIWPEELDPK